MNDDLFRVERIENKEIYIVEKHHQVLLPWTQLRRKIKEPPFLLTFDHHTDTHDAFIFYAYHNYPYSKRPEPPWELVAEYFNQFLP